MKTWCVSAEVKTRCLSEADAAVHFPDGATKVDGSLEVRMVPETSGRLEAQGTANLIVE